jgi:hypothetical protein
MSHLLGLHWTFQSTLGCTTTHSSFSTVLSDFKNFRDPAVALLWTCLQLLIVTSCILPSHAFPLHFWTSTSLGEISVLHPSILIPTGKFQWSTDISW